MRPERLELEGFTAFSQRTVVDFSDVDLFALSGATGAGKSSLIDAIVFVLYGQVPRYGNANKVEPVISRDRVEARIGLDFRLGAGKYRAVRVVRQRANGGAVTREARLERRHEDGSVEVLAGDARGMNVAVEQLLGLSYGHFTTAVVLPQGEFARFLHHKPSDRQELLERLLDLGLFEQVAQRARARTEQSAERKRSLGERLAELADATPEALEQAQGLAVRAEALVTVCADASIELGRLETRAEALAARERTLREHMVQLAALTKPPHVDTLAATHQAHREQLARLNGAVATTEVSLSELEEALAARPSVDATKVLIERHQQLAHQTRQLEKGLALLQQVQTSRDGAARDLQEATAAHVAAEGDLTLARTADAAGAIAAHLHPGDHCPVCGHVVVTLAPPGTESLARAMQRHQAAEARRAAASDAASRAQTELTRVETKLEAVRAAVGELEAQLAGADSLDVATAQLEETEALVRRQREGRQHRQELRSSIEALTARLAEDSQARADAATTLDAARDRLAALDPPHPGRHDLAADWDALLAWAAQRLELEARQLEDLQPATAALGAERAALTTRLRSEARAVLGAEWAHGEPDRISNAAIALRAQLETRAEQLREGLQRAARLGAELAEATEAEQVGRELGRLLRSDQFLRWILDEAVQQLVAGATGMLERLSGGAYSLVLDDREFAVIDHNNADAIRSVRTLSGGETFMASLALALALADQVVTLAGAAAAPLESLFLDEGFGTLDADTLDTVASAIEELGSSGRMVGIVTHVRDLAERLPVRFEVIKSVGGASVTRVLA